jgi:glycine/D-amino acid oxidase-like deaminating enzyme
VPAEFDLMRTRLQCDLAIIGGGIAGLWSLARAREAGFSAVLLAKGPLGAGQTIWSQGIIHGGLKYALSGQATSAARAIAEMPARWLNALQGRGEIDLSAVRPYADHQHLWTAPGLAARFAGLAASHAIRTPVAKVGKADRPEALAEAPFGVGVYRVDEPVLPVRTLLDALAQLIGPAALAIRSVEAITPPGAGDADGLRIEATTQTDPENEAAVAAIKIRARRVLLAAGAGNLDLLALAGHGGLARPPAVMQRRPLHMVVARGALPVLNAHCVGASAKPRLTITTPPDDASGEDQRTRHQRTWLIGGQLAEEGLQRSPAQQAQVARQELEACLPWVKLDGVRFTTGHVDRAEGRTADGQKPDWPVTLAEGPVMVAWPTKLAFAPLLADKVIEWLRASGLSPGQAELSALELGPHASIAPYPWDEAGVAWL